MMKNIANTVSAVHAIPLLLMAGITHSQTPGQQSLRNTSVEEIYVGIEEIYVTAQKRSENLQETPIAISAYSAEDMMKLGVTDVPTLVTQTPSVYGAPYPLSNTILTLYMRGQGNNDPMQITKDGSIGIYENGIYNSRPQSIIFDLADVEQVEVLRGPQGTLYGRNTTGGAMNIVSRAPSGEFGLRQLLSGGDRQQFRSITNIDLPAVARISSKITLAAGNDDGYVKNIGSSNNFNEKQYLGARLALLWKPTESFSADYGYTWADIRTTPGYLNNPSLAGLDVIDGATYRATKYETYRAVDLRKSPTKIHDHTLTLTWELSPTTTLKSLTGQRNLDMTNYTDTVESYGLGIPVVDYLDSEQFSQEFQLIGSIGERVHYVAGLYYFDESAEHLQAGDFIFAGIPPIHYDRYVEADSESQAVYAQLTWTPPVLDDKLELTFGARYTKDSRKASRDYESAGFVIDANTTNDQDFSRSTPSFTAAYAVHENLSIYAKAASGYRAGGSSESGSDFRRTFGPETLDTFELGMKADWLRRRLRTNIALFHSDYEDIQLDVSPDPENVTITQTFNAGKAVIRGVEVDVIAALTPDLRLTLAYAMLDSEVKKVSVPGSPVGAADFVIPYAPDNSFSAALDYTFLRFGTGSFVTNLNYAWKDDAYNTSGAGPNVPGRDYYRTRAYGLLNGRLTLEYQPAASRNPVRVSLWGRNLLDKDNAVYTSAIGSSFTGYSSSTFNYAEPFSYGLEVQFSL